ncbi:MAG TPA: FAD-dependent monooxygenase [Chloroflexota bacterium]|jgi:salicylate hydroxylase
MQRPVRIAIIGGGIGGLTAARALRLCGFDPKVYEATPELKEIGAGVALHPNAMKALRSLELEMPVRAVAWESEYQVVRDGRSGRVLTKTPQRGYLDRRFGATGCTVHRADLLDILAAALPAGTVQLGARCMSIQSSDAGASAQFADGSEIEADVIVGADGIHSAVRASLIGSDAPKFTGKVCWRFLVPAQLIKHNPWSNYTLWIGPHGSVMVYPVRCGELVNVVAHRDNDTWTEESWTRECDRSEVLSNFEGWHESLLRLFVSSEPHYKWALFERDPLPWWTRGRATLLGDAAHPMLPYLGQGAAQAIEDGCVLATALSVVSDDPGAALRLYERSRLPRTTRVVLGARARGNNDQTPSRWTALKRDWLIALSSRFGSDRTGRGFAWLYDYDAGSARALA